jgi:hypothetical protein
MLVKRTEEPKVILTKTIKNIKPVNDDRPPRSHRFLGVSGIALAYPPAGNNPSQFPPGRPNRLGNLGIHLVQVEALDLCSTRLEAPSCVPVVFEGDPGSIILARRRQWRL